MLSCGCEAPAHRRLHSCPHWRGGPSVWTPQWLEPWGHLRTVPATWPLAAVSLRVPENPDSAQLTALAFPASPDHSPPALNPSGPASSSRWCGGQTTPARPPAPGRRLPWATALWVSLPPRPWWSEGEVGLTALLTVHEVILLASQQAGRSSNSSSRTGAGHRSGPAHSRCSANSRCDRMCACLLVSLSACGFSSR